MVTLIPTMPQMPEEWSVTGNEDVYDTAARVWDATTMGVTDFSGDWKPDSAYWEDDEIPSVHDPSDDVEVPEPFTPQTWHKLAVATAIMAVIALIGGVFN